MIRLAAHGHSLRLLILAKSIRGARAHDAINATHRISFVFERLLDAPQERQRLSENARQFARANYDLKTVCLPRQLDWFAALAAA